MKDKSYSEKTEREKMVEEYIKQMNPHIRESLDYQQKNELSRFLNRILPQRGTHIVDIRVTFWFIKSWYLVIQFGVDKRDSKRIRNIDISQRIIGIIINTIFVIILAILIFLVVFYILYLLKSFAGIDIFPDKHLSDFIHINVKMMQKIILWLKLK
jgi:hypothetical protein